MVVGPNGSGKSNIVDAIIWVLGEQGPASLRGGKMEDVIFGGSALRPPLGMADVQLTIDNSARLLPVEFAEVSIARTLFRSGDSEYRLNGSPCRLLDIQELLSDAGVGREQHTIVGQGRLDQVLGADPLQMRGFIEDAAGVGKHRRRKERALRKIQSSETNLEHLSDLLAEIRRQLRPLRQQAEMATRHVHLSEELTRARVVSTVRQLARIREELGPHESSQREEETIAKEAELVALDLKLEEVHHRRLEAAALSARHREIQWKLTASRDRLATLGRFAQERRRTIRAELAFDSEAVVQARLEELQAQLEELQAALPEAVRLEELESTARDQSRLAWEAAREQLRVGEEAMAEVRRAQSESGIEAAGLSRDLQSVSASIRAAEIDRKRIFDRIDAAEERRDKAQAGLEAGAGGLVELESRSEPLTARLLAAEAERTELEELRAGLLEEIRSLEKQAAVHRARAGARAAAESSRAPRIDGLRALPGAALLSELLELKPGHRRALEALVGPVDGVVVVPDRESAERILEAHGPDDAITVVIAGNSSQPVAGAEPLLSEVKILRPEAEAALADVYLADSLSQALRLAARHRHAAFVTAEGALAMGGFVSRGSAEIADAVMRCEREIAVAKQAMAEMEERVAEARRRLDRTRAELRAHEVSLARATEAQWARERQVQTLATEIAHLEETLHAGESGLQALTERAESIARQISALRSAAAINESEVARVRAEQFELQAAYEEASRLAEEARVRWGIAQERKRQLSERIEKVRGSLSSVNAGLKSLGERQAALTAAQELAGSVAAIAGLLTEKTAAWPDEAELSYRISLTAVNELDQKIAGLQQARHNAAKELEELRILARQEDLGRSELKVRQKILEAKLADELNVDPEQMLERLAEQIVLPEGVQPEDPLERLASMSDDVLKRRQIRLERELEQMGNVNPLAAREAEALAEREEFLSTQMADVRASRKDLRQIIENVDEKIKVLFSEAFEDVAAEYERLFKVLFPKGNGKLKLTDPTEILETGVEVEASPSGRSLKRLSLLSGGERALSALALLFAIFKARPSPFYILDEVEAALDDVNLQRFLGLLDGFRGTSQLLVVSHQKRTMEVADVLYGVAIRPDGVSKVISERLNELFPDGPIAVERGLSRNEQ